MAQTLWDWKFKVPSAFTVLSNRGKSTSDTLTHVTWHQFVLILPVTTCSIFVWTCFIYFYCRLITHYSKQNQSWNFWAVSCCCGCSVCLSASSKIAFLSAECQPDWLIAPLLPLLLGLLTISVRPLTLLKECCPPEFYSLKVFKGECFLHVS